MFMVYQRPRRFPRFRGTIAILVMWMTVVSSTKFPPSCNAANISWMEKFALADDREQMLSELIPGSDDYYFYHCLHYQTTGQLE